MAPESYYHLSSDRLYYRKVESTDVALWMPFFVENPNLHFLGIDVDMTEEQLSQDWVERQLNRYNRDGFGHLAVIEKATGDMVAMSGIIKRVVDGKDAMEIAYSVMPQHWGKGYATEAAKCLLAYGRENKIANQFISIIHTENQASMNVAMKNGMKKLYATVYTELPVFIFGTTTPSCDKFQQEGIEK